LSLMRASSAMKRRFTRVAVWFRVSSRARAGGMPQVHVDEISISRSGQNGSVSRFPSVRTGGMLILEPDGKVAVVTALLLASTSPEDSS